MKPHVWYHDYLDGGSQGLQFAWVTITINQSWNIEMLESERVDLVDNFTLKILIIYLV